MELFLDKYNLSINQEPKPNPTRQGFSLVRTGKLLAISLIIIVSIYSCKKEDTSLRVTVYDRSTNLPIPNFHIYVYENNWGLINTGGVDDFNLITDGYTDINGQKDFGEFDCRKRGQYHYGLTDHEVINSHSQHDHLQKEIEKGKANDVVWDN